MPLDSPPYRFLVLIIPSHDPTALEAEDAARQLKLGGGPFNYGVANLREMTMVAGEHTEVESLAIYSKDYTALSINTLTSILQCHSFTILRLERYGGMELSDDDVNFQLDRAGPPYTPGMWGHTCVIADSSGPFGHRLTVSPSPNASVGIDAGKVFSQEQSVHIAPFKRLQELDFNTSPISRKVKGCGVPRCWALGRRELSNLIQSEWGLVTALGSSEKGITSHANEEGKGDRIQYTDH
ncbi:hypothetical protein FRB97_008484 [Tulasnella sp. 331]|nr:hypothetical protein FRB97_008484 [Tulasnella sp. 331]